MIKDSVFGVADLQVDTPVNLMEESAEGSLEGSLEGSAEGTAFITGYSFTFDWRLFVI